MQTNSRKMFDSIKLILKNNNSREVRQLLEAIIANYQQMSGNETERMKALTGSNGRINLDKVPNIIIPNGIAATAWYTKGWYLLPIETPCLIKKMLSFMGQYERLKNQKFQPEEYNAMICQSLAKIFGLPSAKYCMAERECTEYILTPDFLNSGEELVHMARIEECITGNQASTTAIQGQKNKISEQYKYLEAYLRKYRFKGNALPENTIKKVLEDYIKQKFFNRFIKNTDEHLFNTALIVNGDKVRMSDMYDYDFTFTRETTDVVPECKWKGLKNEMILDNGESDITSFISQYKDYPGFKEFLANFINNFSINKMERNIFENTGINIDRNETKGHYEIINQNYKETISAFEKNYGLMLEKEGEIR